MKSLFLLALAGACLVGFSAAQAADLTPPVVAKAIPDLKVPAGAAPHTINVKNTFALKGVTGDVVRFTTTLGDIDVELYTAKTPKTVANFLSYVHKGTAADGGYNNTLIQRAVTGFVLQGGQYYVANHSLDEIASGATVPSEAGISNTTGTIAMALSNGPDSATNTWFFNLADNVGPNPIPDLNDTSDGGPFTVFGRVIENGMATVNAIVALKNYDFSADFGNNPEFANVPLLNTYSASVGLTPADFVYTESIVPIQLTAPSPAVQSLLTLKVLNNSNPKLVEATLTSLQLKLKFLKKTPGTAKITLQAKDAANTKVNTSFTVTVR